MRKVFLVIAGILMFYLVRIFFKRLKNAAAVSASTGYGNGGAAAQNLFTAPKGRSFPTDRVVEDASYTEIEPGPGK